jgi:hypothetical protein
MRTSKTHLIWWANCSDAVKRIILAEVFPEFTIDMEKLTSDNIRHIWIRQQDLPCYN